MHFRLVLLLAAAPAALCAVPDAHATTRASLASWASYYGDLTAAALVDVGVTCKTNWDAFVAGRSTASCTDSFPTDNCATWHDNGPSNNGYDASVEADRLKLKACCYEADGSRYYLPITGPDPSKDDNSVDEKCSEFTRERLGPPDPEDDSCCSACTDPDDASYPYTCTTENYVLVSVCAAGDAPLAPLPSDWDCSTSPSFDSKGTYDDDGKDYSTPDCTALDSAFAAGTDAATVMARVKGEQANDAFGQMRKGTTFVERAMLAGGKFYFMSSMKCGVFLEPTVGTGSFFKTLDNSVVANGVDPHDGTTTTMDLRIYNPTVLAVAGKSIFGMGNVTIVNGSNAGEIEMVGAATAKISGMTNTGTVTATGAQDIFIADTTSSGVVMVNNSAAVLVGIQNSGVVTVAGGTFEMYAVVNSADGVVSFSAGTVTMDDVSNAGSVKMMSGTITATGITNTGNVSIAEGAVDLTFISNEGGTLVVSEGVTGTITLADGGKSGQCSIASTVTTVGFTCTGGGGDDDEAAIDTDIQTNETVTVTTTFVLGGAVEDYGAEEKASIKTVLADEAGVATSAVSLTLTSGSVVVEAEIILASKAAAQTAIDTLTGSGGILASSSNLEAALTTAFQGAGLTTTVTVEEITAAPAIATADAGGCGGGCIGGIIGGSVAAVLLLVLLLLWLSGAFGKKSKTTAPASAKTASSSATATV